MTAPITGLEKRRVGFEPQKKLAHGLVMRSTALQLLGDGMHVAQAALEWIASEDRRRTGGVVTGVGDIARLMDRARRRETDRHTMVNRELVGPFHGFPDLRERAQQIMPGRAQPGFQFAPSDCTTALSRIVCFKPRGDFSLARAMSASSMPRATPRARLAKPLENILSVRR